MVVQKYIYLISSDNFKKFKSWKSTANIWVYYLRIYPIENNCPNKGSTY